MDEAREGVKSIPAALLSSTVWVEGFSSRDSHIELHDMKYFQVRTLGLEHTGEVTGNFPFRPAQRGTLDVKARKKP